MTNFLKNNVVVILGWIAILVLSFFFAKNYNTENTLFIFSIIVFWLFYCKMLKIAFAPIIGIFQLLDLAANRTIEAELRDNYWSDYDLIK